jgi:hypothetical protein
MTPRRPRPPTLFDDSDDEPAPEPFDLDAYLAHIAAWRPYAVGRGEDDDHDDELDWRQR